MTIEIKKPNGEVYMTVWRDERQLKMQLMGARLDGQRPIVQLDEKVLPQLLSALHKLQDQEDTVAIDRACFERGCACFNPRIDKDAVIVGKLS